MSTDENMPAPTDQSEVMVCPDCFTEQPPLADFCRNCGRPLSALATMDPFKYIFAQGWAYRKAVSGETTPIVFWGMWLVFGPGALVLLFGFFDLTAAVVSRPTPTLEGIAGLIVGLLVSALYAAILYRVTRNYLRCRRRVPGTCEHCGCNLVGLTEPRCPECGTAFEPDDLADHDGPAAGPQTSTNH